MASGTMVQLADSVGQIDTSDQISMFEGYQKIFIANGSNIKVADFINTKITTTNIGANPPDFGTILTGGTSGAIMITDFITSLTGATSIYGYSTDASKTFVSGETVTGTDNDSNAISFTLNANESTGPHWYSWDVFGSDATLFGSLPEKAYLGCLYRGRCVLSGNPNYPYQWYMSRQANPWDWVYTANDAQTPIAGGNSDAGEIGDIIRALIPYRDEYLVFGCANSLWVLKGDPAEGGTIQEVDLTKGVFGSYSWCFDGDGNLYFASLNGIHRLPAGFGPVENLSEFVLPKMFSDFSAQPNTHRICMGYDKQRGGILVTITRISDGDNIAYYYDLKTQGWFPEDYPDSCGVYSMFSYDSQESEYSGLLLGSTDGYIRVHDDATKNDADTSSTTAIAADVTLPVLMSEDGNNKLKLISESVTLAGGASGGEFEDSNGVTMEIYSAEDAETLVEDIMDGATPLHTTTITGGGKAERIRNRTSGNAIAIRFKNISASESFGIERVSVKSEEVKRY